MLTTHLNTLPYTKFVLIEDTVKIKGARLLEYIVKNHTKKPDYKTHYLVFHTKSKAQYSHDFSSDSLNWLNKKQDFTSFIEGLSEKCVIIIDSLAHIIYSCGLAETYKILNTVVTSKPNILQVVALLHLDLLEDHDKAVQYFHHLSTLHINLQQNRLSYTFKKGPRKIISQIEDYRFDNDRFITESIKKPDTKIIQETLSENLSTFKISLSDRDKESRDSLVLPYLPKPEGEIHYNFDAIDDWDEEDPDDDLDI